MFSILNMNISSTNYSVIKSSKNNMSFKGYDARPLKSLLMRDSCLLDTLPVAKELEKIGKKHGFGILFEGYDVLEKLPSDKFNSRMVLPWMQDYIHILKDKIITVGGFNRPQVAEKFLNKPVENVVCEKFVKGGNVYIVKKDGTEKIIVGEDDCIKAMGLFKHFDICQIPQADYHIDLFIRPLKDGNILVADDKMTLNILKSARDKLAKESDISAEVALLKLDCLIKNMAKVVQDRLPKSTDEVIKKLEKEGYTTIRVPGRIIKTSTNSSLKNILNYVNAIVHENPEGDLVYITNYSNVIDNLGLNQKIVDRVGLNFEKHFKTAVKSYIKPQNIYFIKGGKEQDANIDYFLRCQDGGIHCMTCEVPAEL